MVGQFSLTSVATQSEDPYVTTRIAVDAGSPQSIWFCNTSKPIGGGLNLSSDTRRFWNASPCLRPLRLVDSA